MKPRVWITSFWGFDPSNEGYLGFTLEGNRSWFLENWRDGDLVLIYGANASMTAPEKRHQALGFLEIEPTLMRDVDRMSAVGVQRKLDNDWVGRWTYAVPVVRAAKVDRRISINHIAAETLMPNVARIIASRGALLTEQETDIALSLPVTPVNVFGEPPLSEEELSRSFTPSRGISPSFGKRNVERTDGEHFLYALQFNGDPARLLNRQPYAVRGKSIVKIGYSNDPLQRCKDHNACLPPAIDLSWKMVFKSRPFPTGEAAKNAEDVLKSELARRGESLGAEFFLCAGEELSSSFAIATSETAQVFIRA